MTETQQFLMKNPTESKIVTARIFDFNVKSLIFFMNRNSDKKHEEHNKILIKHEENFVHCLIESLLTHDMLLIIIVVFNDIMTFKFAQNLLSSSKSWFQKWWKINELHKIKIKSLTMKQYEAVIDSDVMKWFDKYKNALRELKIDRRNLNNFD